MSVTGDVEVRQLNKGRTLLIQAILDGLDTLEYASGFFAQAYSDVIDFIKEARDAGVIRPMLPDPPDEYGQKVADTCEAVVKELRGAGFVVRDGEVELPCAKT